MTNTSSAIVPANNSAITYQQPNTLALPNDESLMSGVVSSSGPSIPYLAVITTRQAKKEFDKYGADIGLFFEKSKAEEAGFVPNEHWREVTDVSMGPESKSGWMSTTFRWAQITQSEEVEVWHRLDGNKGIEYVGPAFSRQAGGMTEWGMKAQECKGQTNPEFQMKRRLLVLLLDSKLNPMTKVPVQISLKGGMGTVYEQERRFLLSEIAGALKIQEGKMTLEQLIAIKETAVPQSKEVVFADNKITLREDLHPFVIMGGRLSLLYSDPQKSPYVHLSERRSPLVPVKASKEDETIYFARRQQKNGAARDIILHGCNWRDLTLHIEKNPETIAQIAEFYSQHAEFSLPGGRLQVPVSTTNNFDYEIEF